MSIKEIFNRILDTLGYLTMAFLLLLMFALGYFLAMIVIMFGWKALLGLIMITAIIGAIESAFLAFITAPFKMIGRLFTRRAPETTKESADNLAETWPPLVMLLLFTLGAMLAVVQAMMRGEL